MLVVIAMLTKKPQGRCRHEFPPSSFLRAEHQVGLGESTTFENENWAMRRWWRLALKLSVAELRSTKTLLMQLTLELQFYDTKSFLS